MNNPKYVYLCNGEACAKQCKNLSPEEWAKHPCHHTTDERFAKTKVRRKRKFKMSRHRSDIVMTEVE